MYLLRFTLLHLFCDSGFSGEVLHGNSLKVAVHPDFIFCTVAILSIMCTVLSVYGMKQVTTQLVLLEGAKTQSWLPS